MGEQNRNGTYLALLGIKQVRKTCCLARGKSRFTQHALVYDNKRRKKMRRGNGRSLAHALDNLKGIAVWITQHKKLSSVRAVDDLRSHLSTAIFDG